MDLTMMIGMCLLNVARIIIPIAIKMILFTGAWIYFLTYSILFVISIAFRDNLVPIVVAYPNIIKYILYSSYVPMFFITTTNIIRTITGNVEFSMAKFIFRFGKDKNTTSRSEKKVINPIINSELIKNRSGFIFGKKNKTYITKPEDKDGHILVIGGAGSGKSSCIAIPSLRSWNQRVFAIDIKGELYDKTENFRPNKKVFKPSDINNRYGYNPFYLLKNSDNLSQDVKEIALAMIPLPQDTKDPFWINSAQNLLTGSMIYCYKKNLNFIQSIERIQTTPVQEMIQEITESDCLEAKLFCNQFVGMDIKTLSGIFTEVSNSIMIFATDKQLKNALSKSEFVVPEDLENGTDIYICIDEHKLEQWKSLLTLIVNQFLKHFERRSEVAATPTLFLLDEFARLGKIETVLNGLATLRSKKVTIAILTQSLAQLDMIYGKSARQVISDNCSYKAILSATDAETQDYFSKLVGTYDKQKISNNANFEEYTNLGKGKGISKTTEEKRIIKPEDFAYLKDIVMLSPMGYFRVDKAPYYED